MQTNFLDVDRGSYHFGSIELAHALFFQHRPCRFHNRTILPFGYAVLFRHIPTNEIAPNSHLLQITIELAGKVLFSAIRPQALDLSPCFHFDETFEVPKTFEDFTLLFNEIDPRVPRIVVDEGDEISTPAKTNVLCRPPYIRIYQVELVPAPVHSLG